MEQKKHKTHPGSGWQRTTFEQKYKAKAKILRKTRAHAKVRVHVGRGGTSRSARNLSDAELPLEAAASGTGEPAGARTDRSRCSMSQRASMAEVFSSSHWSSNSVISLRRLAAWARRESS